MSQHDMTIAGGTTPGSPNRTQVRQDIEAALQALASTSKGSSRPSTVYAGQLWVDDNTPSSTVWTLYLYDGAGDIAVGTIDTTADTFTPTNAPSGVPSGAVMPYAGSSAPTGWLLCYGQAVSRTTYADLFAAISTAHGVGDGSSTFNLPDLRGRAVFGKDNMGGSPANRITNAVASIAGTTLGAVGGAQSVTLAVANIAQMTISSLLRIASTVSNALTTTGGGGDSAYYTFDTGGSATVGTATPDAVNKMPPAIILNYIIKT